MPSWRFHHDPDRRVDALHMGIAGRQLRVHRPGKRSQGVGHQHGDEQNLATVSASRIYEAIAKTKASPAGTIIVIASARGGIAPKKAGFTPVAFVPKPADEQTVPMLIQQ